MAQTINVPIAFEWHRHPAKWSLASATIMGWKPRTKHAYVEAKVEHRGTQFVVDLDTWRLRKTLNSTHEGFEDIDFIGHPIDLLVCDVNWSARTWHDDPWPMRDEFLRLKRDNIALLRFLNQWGVWGATETSVTFIPAGAEASVRKKEPLLKIRIGALEDQEESMAVQIANPKALYFLLPVSIWEFQKECRTGLNKPAEKWLSKHTLRKLHPRREYPHHVLAAVGSRTAILDTIVIDHLRKVRFRLCARHDCRTPFAIESRHQREYCCQYCAHIESVRKQRALKREAAHEKEMSYAKRQET